MAKPLIIAHRGASAELPENTIAAFERALALGVDAIELDVHVTRDGVPVVFHDSRLRRLTGRPGAITAQSWKALQALRVLGSDEPIPRLQDVLSLTRGRAVVQIEIKGDTPVAPVIAAVRRTRATEWAILASFSERAVANAARLALTIPRMLISEGRRSPAALAAQLAACRAGGLSVNHRAIKSAAWVRFFHARGSLVWTWTVNDLARASRLRSWGVDGIMGDNPALLRRLD